MRARVRRVVRPAIGLPQTAQRRIEPGLLDQERDARQALLDDGVLARQIESKHEPLLTHRPCLDRRHRQCNPLQRRAASRAVAGRRRRSWEAAVAPQLAQPSADDITSREGERHTSGIASVALTIAFSPPRPP